MSTNPRTHDLRALVNLAAKEVPDLERFRERLLPLNAYAVAMRYDDVLNPDSEEVSNALSTSEELRDAVLDLLPPDARP